MERLSRTSDTTQNTTADRWLARRLSGIYQPEEYGNVGRGAMYEVTGSAYKHIALTSQRRESTHRQLVKDAEVLATHAWMSTGRTRSDGAPHLAGSQALPHAAPTDA